jgi:hypothetical protein
VAAALLRLDRSERTQIIRWRRKPGNFKDFAATAALDARANQLVIHSITVLANGAVNQHVHGFYSPQSAKLRQSSFSVGHRAEARRHNKFENSAYYAGHRFDESNPCRQSLT